MQASCPSHTVIIKGSFTYSSGNQKVPRSLRNIIYDTCGDNDIKQGRRKYDPSLKFFYNMPLMLTSNDRLDENLANGTSCRGLHVVLRKNAEFVKEIWNGYLVNTIEGSQIHGIVCKKENKEGDSDEYFYIEPERTAVNISIPLMHKLPVKGIKIEQLPVNDNIATTGHKLQGATLLNLVVKSWDYSIPNWIYVVLSRVRTLKGLVFCKKLDENRTYPCDPSLLHFEQRMRNELEQQLFATRNEMNEYLKYEEEYMIIT